MDEKRIRLLYAWEGYSNDLNLEIQAAEKQLQSVKKRLYGIKYDIFLFAVLIVLPWIFIEFMKSVPNDKSVIYILWTALESWVDAVYSIAFPFLIYRFVMSVVLYMMNRPPREVPNIVLSKRYKAQGRASISAERNFWIEEQKLVAVLAKYYVKRQNLDDIKKQILETDEEITLVDLQIAFEKIPYYVEIRPADSFSSPMMKTARTISLVVCLCIVACVILPFISKIFWIF